MKINFVSLNIKQKQNINQSTFLRNNYLKKSNYSAQFSPHSTDVFIKNNSIPKTNTQNINFKGLHQTVYPLIKILLNALNDKNPYTHNHSVRVGLYSAIFAKETGLDKNTTEEVEISGLLHDIGKITVPNEIICKEGKLTPEEYEIMKTHPVSSKLLLSGYKGFEFALPIVKHHHERWDGKGYPNGLKGEEIPYFARMISILDTYDAMTSQRPYRNELSHEEAIQEITKSSGSQFDPTLTDGFLALENKIMCAKSNPKDYLDEYSIIHKTLKDI